MENINNTSPIIHNTSMQVKLSIVVPVYNVEKYLCKCVDSLIHQDIREYEIILVDDGSTDGSGELCNEIVRANDGMSRADALNEPHVLNDGKPQIRVIHKENGGLSAARNIGIEVAKGEYIMFVDSDDYLESNVLGKLLRTMEEKQLDVLRFNYQNVNEQGEIIHPNKAPKRDVDYSELVTDGETFLNERLGPMCYAVMFIIKRDLIYNDGMNRDKSLNEPLSLNDVCMFTPGIYFEDTEWTPRMLLRAKRVASTSKVVYNYLWREGSITLPNSPAKHKKVLEDKMRLIRRFQEQSELVKDSIWFRWMETNTVMTILSAIAVLPVDSRKLYIKELNALHVFPLMTKKEKMWTHRLKIYLANLSPKLYCTLMSLLK